MDDGMYSQLLTQVIQTVKLFIKFAEQLNRSCLEKKRGGNKVEKKPVAQENDSSIMKGGDPKKKVKLDKPKEIPQQNTRVNQTQTPPLVRPQDHKEEAGRKVTSNLYSFKDQKTIDLRLPDLENKDLMQMGPYGPMPTYNFFGHPHNPLFSQGMPPGMAQGMAPGMPTGVPFYPSMDPLAFFNFQNKPVFPSYFIQQGMTPDKLHYFGMPLFNQKNFMMPPVQPDPKLIQKPQVPRERKLFKRASYHVAIAYNIHLQKLNKKSPGGNVDPNQLDPTYKARSLKEQKGGERPNSLPINREPPKESDNVRAQVASEQRETTVTPAPIQPAEQPKPVSSAGLIDLTSEQIPPASLEPPAPAVFEPPSEQPTQPQTQAQP